MSKGSRFPIPQEFGVRVQSQKNLEFSSFKNDVNKISKGSQ